MSKRQGEILKLVKEKGPITGEDIGQHFNLTRATLRPDLAILTMAGILEARPRVGYYYAGSKGRSFVSTQLETILVKNIKALPVVIEAGQSVYDAIVMLFLEDLDTLFVVDKEGNLTGVITSKDLLKVAVGNSDLHTMPVEMVMSRYPQVVSLDEESTLAEALLKMGHNQVGCLPVLKNGKQITGRFDRSVILKFLDDLAQGHLEEVQE